MLKVSSQPTPGRFLRRSIKTSGTLVLTLIPCILGGTISASAATVSPSTLSWAAVAVGGRGGQKVVTLTNGGTAAITISSIALTGANPGDFQIFSKTCAAKLAASASCTANIVFGPTALGTRTATLNFNDSGGNSPQTVAISGLATSGVVLASPSSIAFGSSGVGTRTAAQTVTLSNGNTLPITISGITVSGAHATDFVVAAKSCGASLSVGASCTASVIFTPSATGTRSANLIFADSASSSPQTVVLAGIGGAAPATASVSPASLTFGNTSVGAGSAPQSVTLSNGPASSITISSVTVSGANASDFVLQSTTCGASLPVSSTCTATIIFKPGAAGTRAASLSFVDSATNSPQSVTLSGTGSTTGAALASPASVSWAAVAVGGRSGQRVVTLTNANTTAITLGAISFTGANPGDFLLYSKTCGTTLAPAASCTANIVFGPTVTGSRTATLNFNDSDIHSPQVVPLSGVSTSGIVGATPSSLAFSNVTVGTGTVPQSVAFSNGSTLVLTISSIAVNGANASDFVVSGTTCGASLSVGSSCSVALSFRPTAPGPRTASLTFSDSASNGSQVVSLSGNGGTILTISPQNSTIAVNASVLFTASVPSTWMASCGSIGSDGTFTAPSSAGSCNVVATATDGSGQSASTSVTTTLASVTITPNTVNLHALNTQTFTADQPVTWSASCGTISPSGVFTAPSSPATCSLTATTTSGTGQTGTASINVDMVNYTARKSGGGLTGSQTNELTLTPSNVNATTFGLSWTAAVDGWVSAQPLYMNALMVNGVPHNVVFAATANDSVYAFDGDTGAVLWQVSLLPPGATSVVSTTVGFKSAPLIGILGTPVIDPATNTMYLVAETSEQNGNYFPHRLHALDVTTGSEKLGGPVLVSDPNMAPVHKLQRTGLTLANGNVYFAIGSMQDMQPYHGLVFAFNAQTLAEQAVWVSTPTGSEGGVWMGGSPPAVDADGNIYVTTGNGTLDGSANFGEAVVKLSPGLQPLDYFAPYNFFTYNSNDVDLGSGNVMVVPDQTGSYPHELIACGKPTPIYVLNRDNMGQLGATSDNVIQRLDNQLGVFSASTNSVEACFTSPAMWGQNVYYGGKYDALKMFALDPNTGLLSSTPVSQGTLAYGYPGTEPVVSSNGATNGIVWTIDTKTVALIASDATNVANTLFSGALTGSAVRWAVPTVVNGHVYVGEQGTVYGFALK